MSSTICWDATPNNYSQNLLLPSCTISTGCFLPWNQSSKIQRTNKSDGFSRKNIPPLFLKGKLWSGQINIKSKSSKYRKTAPATINQSPAAKRNSQLICKARISSFPHIDLYPDQQLVNLESYLRTSITFLICYKINYSQKSERINN